MKNQLTLLLIGSLMAASVGLLAPAKAETGVKFYCGQDRDPLSRSDIPTTLISVPGRETPTALIRWKSEYFSGYSPQERCNLVSPKFQAAYQSGRLNFLATGKDRGTGQGIVCGLVSAEEGCEDHTNMLFTLKPYGSKKLVLSQIVGILTGEGSKPIYQSSGEKEVVDLRTILPVIK